MGRARKGKTRRQDKVSCLSPGVISRWRGETLGLVCAVLHVASHPASMLSPAGICLHCTISSLLSQYWKGFEGRWVVLPWMAPGTPQLYTL